MVKFVGVDFGFVLGVFGMDELLVLDDDILQIFGSGEVVFGFQKKIEVNVIVLGFGEVVIVLVIVLLIVGVVEIGLGFGSLVEGQFFCNL